MEDYLLDEQLLKDIQEATSSPKPYQPKTKQLFQRPPLSTPPTNTTPPNNNNNPPPIHKPPQFPSTTTNPRQFTITNTTLNDLEEEQPSTPSFKTNQNIFSFQTHPNPHLHPYPPQPSSIPHPKSYTDLEHAFQLLSTQFEKITANYQSLTITHKNLKSSYDTLCKEHSLLSKQTDQLSKDKLTLETQLTELKAYNRKVETRLVAGVKNQNIIEINNKLRCENEKLQNSINHLQTTITSLLSQLKTKDEQISHLNITLTTKADALHVPPDNLYRISLLETEQKALNEKLQSLTHQNQHLTSIISNNETTNQEIKYANKHLTELIVVKEKNITQLSNENETLKITIGSLRSEVNELKTKCGDYTYIQEQNVEMKKLISHLEEKANTNTNAVGVVDSNIENENNELRSTIKQIQKDNSDMNYKYKQLEQRYVYECNENQKHQKIITDITNHLSIKTDECLVRSNNTLISDIINAITNAKNKNITLINSIKHKLNLN